MDFHLNEPVVLHSFFPNPSTAAERSLHSLDVRRCIRFYMDRNKEIGTSDQLFVTFWSTKKRASLVKARDSEMHFSLHSLLSF